MAQTSLITSIDRSVSYPLEITVDAANLCGTISVAPNNWTEQMLYELPTVNISVYTPEDVRLMSVDVSLQTYSSDTGKITCIDPYVIPIYNIPETVILKISPVFDAHALQSHNEQVMNGNVSIFDTTIAGVVNTNMAAYASDLWTTPTQTFDISIEFDDANINSGGGSGGGGSVTPEEEHTYTGAPPLTFESNGEPAKSYSITGQMEMSGTPTPANPIYPTECGTLVTSGEHAGEYAIEMSVGGTTQTIYLDEPLRSFGQYADVLNSDGTVTRRIYKITMTGSESWSYTSSQQKMLFNPSNFPGYLYDTDVTVAFCSHYEVIPNKENSYISNGQLKLLIASSGTLTLYLRDNNYTDSATWTAHLTSLYSAGTPVCLWYILANEATESFEPVEMQLSKGSNTLSFNTASQPSDVTVVCTTGGGAIASNTVTYNNSKSGLTATNVQKAIDEVAMSQSKLFNVGYSSEKVASYSQPDYLYIDFPGTNVKKNNVYTFSAKITSFDTLQIGEGYGAYSGAWAEITDTKIIVHNYTNSDSTVEYTHGLTISDYIFVQIIVKIGGFADISITSGGSTFKQANVAWSGTNGDYYVSSEDGVFTDSTFTWSCADFRKSVWIFGDSYVGLNNPARWATQLRNAGYADNVLINGYAGESSSAAVTSLQHALENYGKPKTLVWCMGMNDGADSGTTPSAKYSSAISQVEYLCNIHNIELVYATIPSVPSQNNEGKNAYVRGKGTRYIDFAKAVGATSAGVWYTGMLSNDNVHPTELGAVALYYQAIADCPEMTYSNP